MSIIVIIVITVITTVAQKVQLSQRNREVLRTIWTVSYSYFCMNMIRQFVKGFVFATVMVKCWKRSRELIVINNLQRS